MTEIPPPGQTIEKSVDQTSEAQDLDSRISQAEPANPETENQPPGSDQAGLENNGIENVADNRCGKQEIPIDQINENDIKSPEDFKSPAEYQSYLREAGMLKQMQPALDQGATVDTFHSWDQTYKIGHYSENQYIRGYADVYNSYYSGNEPVALDRQADGTYNVINGNHRIFACKQAGFSSIPAKVL